MALNRNQEALQKAFIADFLPLLSMGSFRKRLAIVLVLIVAISCLSLLMVKPTSAQAIPKLSVPEFTINLITSSLENNPANKTIELTIKN